MTEPTAQQEFLNWYAPVHERFLRYCDARCLGLGSAEDLVQDAVLSALEQWDALENKNRLLAYMIGIVNNRLRNELRSRAVHRRYVEHRKRALSDRLPARPEAALDLHFLLKAMDELPANQREALLLQAVSGFTIREIADLQQVSPGAVKTRISRARTRLKEIVGADECRADLRQRLHTFTSILL